VTEKTEPATAETEFTDFGPRRDFLKSFKVINPVSAPFSAAGRSSQLVADDKFGMAAWTCSAGVIYQFPGKPLRMTPWANVIEVEYTAE
jgi:hypothetical protein